MCYGISNSKKSFLLNNISNISKNTSIFHTLVIFFAVFVLLFGFNPHVQHAAATKESDVNIEEKLNGATEDVLANIDFSEIDKIVEELDIGLDGYNTSFGTFVAEIISGKIQISFDTIIKSIKSSVVPLMGEILRPLILILMIILICNLMNSLKSGRIETSVGDVIFFICLSVIVIILAILIKEVIDVSKDTISKISEQLNAIYPIIITLISGLGATQSASSLSWVSTFFSGTLMNVIEKILFPIFTFVIVMTLISKIMKNGKLDNMIGFFVSGFKWILGSLSTIFMAVLSISGVLVGTKDGLSVKAAKYAIKNYVPLLGGYISDGFELVKAGSLLVKNAVGIGSLILVFFIVLKPILYLGVLSLGLKLISGISSVIDNANIAGLLINVSNALKLLIALVIGSACMYFFLMIILIGCGNLIF